VADLFGKPSSSRKVGLLCPLLGDTNDLDLRSMQLSRQEYQGREQGDDGKQSCGKKRTPQKLQSGVNCVTLLPKHVSRVNAKIRRKRGKFVVNRPNFAICLAEFCRLNGVHDLGSPSFVWIVCLNLWLFRCVLS
jgi:hypothetical protein